MKLKEYPQSLWQTAKLRYGSLPINHQQADVVVSLTSIPSRLAMLDVVIKSLLNQSVLPRKIILWLHASWPIPKRLQALAGDRFEIRLCEGTSSYRKLLPALQAFPEQVIVTCDDDVIYPKNWLEKLVNTHRAQPHAVVCQVARRITLDDAGDFLPYGQWPFLRANAAGYDLLPIGFAGVLYPVGCFHDDVTNAELYESLSPKADDLWFKAMHLLAERQVFIQSFGFEQPIPIVNTQAIALGKTNIKADGNLVQWKSIVGKYPQIVNYIYKKEV